MAESTESIVYVTGGTGFIGSAFIANWIQRSTRHKVIVQTRNPQKYADRTQVNYVRSLADCADSNVTAIVNLAGAPIADQRWSVTRKKTLESSRIDLTSQLASSALKVPPSIVISASAVGYYGLGDQLVDENSLPGQGYAADLCCRWEEAAKQFSDATRLIIFRLGVVLGQGGMLQKLLPLYKAGLGGRIASGQQWLSWIHLHDVVGAITAAIEDQSWTGVYNLTAPEPVTQASFSRSLSAVLNRPCFLPTPGWVLQAAFGQMARELLIGGQRVVPARLRDKGFEFQYPELALALSQLLRR